MALLAWVTTTFAGESEIAIRVLSAVPFVAGVVLVTARLHLRFGRVAGVVFMFLVTVSPLLLDITRQARGYGIAFLAMGAVTVCALEATRTGSTWAVVGVCAGGIVGAWTLPQFAIAFAPRAAVLLLDRRVRTTTAVRPRRLHRRDLCLVRPSFQVRFNPPRRSPTACRSVLPWVVTAPIDQILLPALIWIDGTASLERHGVAPPWSWWPSS